MNEDKQKQVKAEQQTGKNNAQVAANDAATYFASHKNNRLNNELNNGQNNISKRNIDGINGSQYNPYNQINRTRPNTSLPNGATPNKKVPKKGLPSASSKLPDTNKTLPRNNSKALNSNNQLADNNEEVPSTSDANTSNIGTPQESKNVSNSNLPVKKGLIRKTGIVPQKALNKKNIKEQENNIDNVEHGINKAVAAGKKTKEAIETIVKIKRTLIIVGVFGGIVLIILLLIILIVSSSGGAVASLQDDCYGGDDTGWWWPIGGATDSGENIYDGEPVYKDTNPSDYGPRDPRIGTSSFHSGVDISVNGVGDPVIATKSGVAEVVEYSSSRHNHSCSNGVNKLCDQGVSDCYGYGNYIMIDHNDGTKSLYGHLSEVEVVEGEHVEQGQLIGKTGSTGMSTGPHLHFEIRINGATKDPLNYISIDNPRPGKKTCDDNGNSLCAGTNGDLISFLANWEGNEGYCRVDGVTGYQSKNLGDGAITLGPGFTNFAMSADVVNYIHSNGYSKYFPGDTVSVGMCVPIDIFAKVQLFAIENSYAKTVDEAAQRYGVTLTQFQKDALTDFNYNQGSAYINQLMSAYASDGYKGLWNAMAQHTKGGMTAIKKRLKGEFALFVTGDYSDQGKFYSRNLNNFYDYDSEGVMARKAVCNDSLVRKTRPTRDNQYYYSADQACGAAGTLEGECAWYGTGRAKEYLASINSPVKWTYNGDAGTFCDSADARKFKQGTTPKAGSLIVWSYNPYGHVAFVEEVYDDGSFLISEAFIRLGLVTSRSQLHAWGNNCAARRKNCEGNGSGCFRIQKATKSSNSGFRCFIYLNEPK